MQALVNILLAACLLPSYTLLTAVLFGTTLILADCLYARFTFLLIITRVSYIYEGIIYKVHIYGK